MNTLELRSDFVPRELLMMLASGLIISLFFTPFAPVWVLVCGSLAYSTVAYACYVYAKGVFALRLDEVVEAERPLTFWHAIGALLLPPLFVLGLFASLWSCTKCRE